MKKQNTKRNIKLKGQKASRALGKVRKSYILSAVVITICILTPAYQAAALLKDRYELDQIRTGIHALKPNSDPAWHEELANYVLVYAPTLEIPEGTTIDGKPVNKAAFLLSQMWVESRFEPKARSRSNAQGLMQVKPTTAHILISSLDLPRKRTYYGPEENLRLGVKYMNDLFTSFNNLMDATFAYNIGPGAYRRGKKNQFYWDKIIRTYRYLVQI